MHKQKIAKVLLSSIIITSLAASPAFAESTGSTTSSSSASASNAVKLKFPDVKSDYWGIRHITKLATEGIIDGYEDGTYRSETSVSQQDVIIMAIRMMGLESEVKSRKDSTVLPDYLQVDDYARNYVAVARDHNLITLPEEKLNTENTKTKWGARTATREWVAKIVIRSIGKQESADSQAAAPTSFKDNNDISYSALGYINAAVSLQIVNGFEDGSFQPKGSVTRAQMAAFLSRSQKELETPPSRVVRGYVNSLSGTSVSLMDKDGNVKNYTLSNDAVFYGNKDDNKIQPTVIQQTYEVSLVQVGGTAYYVEVLSDQLQLDVKEGSLFKANLSDLQITMFSNEVQNYVTYSLAPNVTVTDQEGHGLSMGSLVKDSIIEIRKSKLVKSDAYTQIVVKQVPVTKSSEGAVSLKNDNQKIEILETSTGKKETYSLTSQTLITMADNTVADFSSLHVGDTISYDIVNSQLTKIVIKKQADFGISVEGTFNEIGSDKTSLTFYKKTDNQLGAYTLADNIQVQIDGLVTAGLLDLQKGDAIKLDLLNNKVVKITTTNRAVNNNYFSKIISYDATSKVLTVVDSEGKPNAFTLTDSTSFVYMGVPVTLANFTNYFSTGKRVNLKVSNDKIISIEFSSQIDGTVSQMNVASNDLTIKTSGGQLLIYKVFPSQEVSIPNKTNGTAADLTIGDTISLTLSADQIYVSTIVISKSFVYKIALANNNSKQVTLLDDAGATYSYSLDGIPLVKPDLSTGAFTDLVADDYVKLTFKGSTIVKGEIITPDRGKITAVDATTSSVTLQDGAGNSKVVGFGANYAIKQNGGGSLTFASLKVGDRVQVKKDAAGKMQIQVAAASARVFASYDSVLSQFVFTSTSANDKLRFATSANAHFHKGSEVLTLGSFAANDPVTIYVMDDKIIEIEKK